MRRGADPARREYRLTRSNPYQGHPCHIEIILSTPQSEVARSKDLDNVKTGKTVAAIEA